MKNSDKFDCRAIKELIKDEKISLASLKRNELEMLIDFETENVMDCKTEPDTSFLDECYEALRKYTDYSNIVSEERIREISENAYNLHFYENILSEKRKKRTRIFTRIGVCFAAICFVIFSSFSVMALATGGYSQAWECISNRVHKILNMDKDNEVIDGIEIIKSDYTKKYATIEELLLSEKLDILYPAALPDGVKIERLKLDIYNNNQFEIKFLFNTSDINLTIKDRYSVNIETISKSDGIMTYTVGDINFYITSKNNEIYQGIAQINGYEYLINTANHDLMIYIISNLKGLEL
ncbi:MAG: hypothetical protein J6D11_08090 [Clostridia bacterium]|nr:hypothetical protein [Clostridia bacterium]